MGAKEYLISVGKKIQRVYNPDLIELIVCRYIKGMTQEQTAEKMGVSDRTIREWEKSALQIFDSENTQKS